MIRRSACAYFQVAFSVAGRCRGAERTHAAWNGSRRRMQESGLRASPLADSNGNAAAPACPDVLPVRLAARRLAL